MHQMNEILVRHGIKAKIRRILNVNPVTVDRALHGITKSDLAKRIRKKTLELGGVEVPTKK